MIILVPIIAQLECTMEESMKFHPNAGDGVTEESYPYMAFELIPQFMHAFTDRRMDQKIFVPSVEYHLAFTSSSPSLLNHSH